MEELLIYIEKFAKLTEEERLIIQRVFTVREVAKGAYFTASGKISHHLAFVESGVFRSLYYNKTGDDFTRYFIYEGRFIGDLHNFLIQAAANDYVEAITDARIWCINYENFRLLEKEISVWPLLIAKLYAFVTESKLKTANMMLNLDAKERYLLFLSHYPGLVNRVPLSMLASYLGITSSSLSRIRRGV
ncbi:Crp/Fnr family transcriptional regulator [Myroides sp. DF42-4-2]|uniref:Crp/Fnr family transcriptional regulator n=1 Tax=unclassified Myroides TaxID=2642485 RepID=UPI0025749E50|nr:Crp/Fnr family transcriptional regulator [Myroides sp. DF42-4-2]MDM1408826.1 Crp/Fnr family transcriptional regulator [Myroides sp. DF42-4-2]